MRFDFAEAERKFDEMEQAVGAAVAGAQTLAETNAKAIHDDFMAFLGSKGKSSVSGARSSTSVSFVDDWKRFEVEADLDGTFNYRDVSKKPGYSKAVVPRDNHVDADLLMQALISWSRMR